MSNFLTNWMEEAIEGSVTEGRRGNYKPGFWESIGGSVLGIDAQGVADDLKTSDNKREADRYLTSIGETPESLGLTGNTYTLQDVKGAYTKTSRTRQQEDKKGDREFQTSLVTQQLAPTLAKIEQDGKTAEGQLQLAVQTLQQQGKKADQQLQLQLTQGNQQMQLAMQQGNQQMQLTAAQMAQANNQFLAQMADSKDQRAAELEIRKMEMDREDLRYNEALDRQEKNRRKENIAALVQGLAGLGAAFAM